jgi:hypothetical protein
MWSQSVGKYTLQSQAVEVKDFKETGRDLFKS